MAAGAAENEPSVIDEAVVPKKKKKRETQAKPPDQVVEVEVTVKNKPAEVDR